jgi:hypothetical protein
MAEQLDGPFPAPSQALRALDRGSETWEVFSETIPYLMQVKESKESSCLAIGA